MSDHKVASTTVTTDTLCAVQLSRRPLNFILLSWQFSMEVMKQSCLHYYLHSLSNTITHTDFTLQNSNHKMTDRQISSVQLQNLFHAVL